MSELVPFWNYFNSVGKFFLLTDFAQLFTFFVCLHCMNVKDIDIIRNYFKTKPIAKAWIFGSYSRDEERADSDVDILVSLQDGAKMGFAFAGMICDLEDLLNKNVDLVVDGTLLPFAQESVNNDKILIYERADS